MKPIKLERYKGNPILTPTGSSWESKAVFNAGAIYLGGKIHLVYRAISEDNTSCLGYARLSDDGHTLKKRSRESVYNPDEIFEIRIRGGGNIGCEDPRLTLVEDRVYMCYVAVNDALEPRVAMTSIEVKDFLNENWIWQKPVLISLPRIWNKNACVIPLEEGYAFFHRIYPDIWIDVRESLEFKKGEWIQGEPCIKPRERSWDSKQVGIAGPPLKIKEGWLLIYHGVSNEDGKYRLGVVILDGDDPRKVISRYKYPILEPYYEGEEGKWQRTGQTPNAIFSCGAVGTEDQVLIYYSAADTVICLATASLRELVNELLQKDAGEEGRC